MPNGANYEEADVALKALLKVALVAFAFVGVGGCKQRGSTPSAGKEVDTEWVFKICDASYERCANACSKPGIAKWEENDANCPNPKEVACYCPGRELGQDPPSDRYTFHECTQTTDACINGHPRRRGQWVSPSPSHPECTSVGGACFWPNEI